MNLAEVVSTWCSDGLIEQFLTADAPKQLAHFLHEFLTKTQHYSTTAGDQMITDQPQL